jgi:hypothetical protein
MRRLDEPFERLSDPRVLLEPEADEPARHVGGGAVEALSLPEASDTAPFERRFVHPVLTRPIHLRAGARRSEIGQREHVPVGAHESRPGPSSVPNPPAGWVSTSQDLRRPPGFWNTGLRVPEFGITFLSPEELGQDEVPDRWLLLLQPPIDRPGDRQRHPKTRRV